MGCQTMDIRLFIVDLSKFGPQSILHMAFTYLSADEYSVVTVLGSGVTPPFNNCSIKYS